MLLPLQLFSSIKLKVLGVRVVILILSPPLKEITINFISDVAVSNSAPQNFFFFGINYHDKINGCKFTKLTGMKNK